MGLLTVLGLSKQKTPPPSGGVPPKGAPSGSGGTPPVNGPAPSMDMLNLATQYAPLLADAQKAIAAWNDPAAAAHRAKIQAVVIDAARAKATGGDYKAALALLGNIGPAIEAAKQAVQKALDEKALDDAKKAVKPIIDAGAALVAGIAEPRLRKGVDTRVKKLQADFDAAGKLADLKAAAQAVLALKPVAEKLKTDAQAAKDESAFIVGEHKTLADNAQSWVNVIESKPGKQAVQQVFNAILAKRDGFLDAGDAKSVKTVSHPEVQRLYTLARSAADQKNEKDKAYKLLNLVEKIGPLATPALQQEAVAVEAIENAGVPKGNTLDKLEQSLKAYRDRMAKLRADVEAARTADAGANSDKKKAALEKTLALYKEAVDGVVDPAKAAGTKKLAALNKKLTDAMALTDAAKRGAALVALDAEAHVELKAMKTEALKAQIAKSGNKSVDDMIAKMGKTTDSDDDLAICEAAMQARFGIQVTVPTDLKRKSLPRFYTAMAKVPAWQTKHAKFKKLEIDQNRKGGDAYYDEGNYPGGTPTIALHDVPDDAKARKVPDVDPKKKTVKVEYFEFTTLHEVGHSVDAQVGFMSQRMNNATYGGWDEPKTTDAVAEYFGDKGGFYARHMGGTKKATKADLKAFLVQYLNTRDAEKPKSASAHMGSLIDQWDDLEADPITKICEDGLRVDDEAWEGGAAKAAKIKVNGRCFHNSYGGDTWVSYDYGSRAPTGVSTYQWRAPGEWFAEIYALYYMDKLSKGHPMTEWFEKSAISEEKARKPASKKAAAKAKG